uniref:Asparagine synthetase [glutamine-hydrolyzing] n=1 Tax=Panagrolaimus sp. JU765 TaxID=591449 RepID=A0AC34QHN7_9BILA
MCGITAICHEPGSERFILQKASELSKLQRHRGPDSRNSYQNPKTGDIICHERLAIMDLTCTQPLQGTKSDHQVVHNGEIYNHEILRHTELKDYRLQTTCDSEVIVFLYEKYRDGFEVCSRLDGVFAFALIFEDDFLVARDPIGVKPLYYGVDKNGRHLFASEMKVIEKDCGDFEVKAFPPGHFWTRQTGFVRYYEPEWFNYKAATHKKELHEIKQALIDATHKRLMSDVPIGVLLSGGLDSSLVSSIAMRQMKKLGLPLKSFSIGLDEHAPDLKAAREVAKFLGTEHHEFNFTIEEGISILKDLIWHLETYDVTSIRASTPMYFLSKKIADLGVKVVLSGEGADEIFGGYLYFHNAPNDEEFQKETIRRVQLLSTADCLRADKSCMAHGIEARVPFLDKHFLDVAMMIRPQDKRPTPKNGSRPIEKYILRQSFDHDAEPYLPREILWRQKEQFSDGVGYSWIDQLMKYCHDQVSDEDFEKATELFPHNTPHSKEAFFMRKIFHEHYPSEEAARTVLKWIPKWQLNQDPSGRASQIHMKTVEKPQHADGCAVEKTMVIEQRKVEFV